MDKKLKHFSDKDAFGGIENMDTSFLKNIDIARHVIRQPCIILCGYSNDSAHVSHSRHKALPCDASDFYYLDDLKAYKTDSDYIGYLHRNLDCLILQQKSRTVFEQIILLRLAGVKRIGIYPFGIPRTYIHANNTLKNKIDHWIGLHVEGIFKKLKKYLPEFRDELDGLLRKIRKRRMHKRIVYIYPS